MNFLNVLLFALVAHAAPGLHTIEEREEDITQSDKPVLLSLIAPFEPWPGYFRGPRQKYNGSQLSINACGSLQPFQDKGWLFKESVCNRQDDAYSTFNFVCAAEANHQQVSPSTLSSCGSKNTCMEFHAENPLNEKAWDVACLSNQTLRLFKTTGVHSDDGTKDIKCSPLYTNDLQSGKTANVSLLVNVLDQMGFNRIAPADIHFNLVPDPQKGGTAIRTGVQRPNDAVVGSGPVAVPPGSSLQACVQPVFIQTISIYVNINGLDFAD